MNSGQRGSIALALSISFVLASCDQATEVVDTTIKDDSLTLEKSQSEANSVAARPTTALPIDKNGRAETDGRKTLPKITSNWLVGTWGPAELNPDNDPSSSCETDVIITFAGSGVFSDGGSQGRFSTTGKSIRYFERRSLPDIASDPDEPFFPEALEEFTGAVRPVDQNTFEEDGAKWRRCKSY